MEERMTVCNMSIEGGARCGYVNPDAKTVEFLGGCRQCPRGGVPAGCRVVVEPRVGATGNL
ncbi:MAG: hypothetical protein CM1200mP2_50060 [Planctomycetaceae bacterium]|nr:MAG: hypothetical protein CM1200mP2_50060 [Planctomycetaceae bacterium]